MKKSAKIMVLGIGIILVGIIGVLFNLEPSTGIFYWFLAQGVPVFSMFAGPLLLLIGVFMKD